MGNSKSGGRRRVLTQQHVDMVAYMASTGLANKTIARDLDLYPSMVSRLLATAAKTGRLTAGPQFLGSDEEKKQVQELVHGDPELFEALNDRFGAPLMQLHVLDDGGLARPAAQRRMTDIAARNLLVNALPAVIANADRPRVGIAWGPTAALLVESIRKAVVERYVAQSNFRDMDFVQICGDPPPAIANPAQRCSTLVSALNATLTGNAHSPFTFSAGASIPRDFADADVEVIRRYIRGIGGYGQIFGDFEPGRPRLLFNLDMLITSCGSGRAEDDGWVSGCAEQEGIDAAELERLVVGNIGGIWLPRDDLSVAQQAVLETINARWNGIALEDIRNVNGKRGGVVCIALDDSKRRVVVELLRRKLVSRLFVSRTIAHHLKDVVAEKAPQ